MSRGKRGLGENQMLKHNRGSTTGAGGNKKSKRIGQSPATAASSRSCPPSPRPAGSLPPSPGCLLFTSPRCGPGRAPACPPRPAAALREPPARSAPLAAPRFPGRSAPLAQNSGRGLSPPAPRGLPARSPGRGLPPLPCPCPRPLRRREPAGKSRNKLRGGRGSATPAGLRGGSAGACRWVCPFGLALRRFSGSALPRRERHRGSPSVSALKIVAGGGCAGNQAVAQHPDISAFHLPLFANRLMTATNNLVSETCNFTLRG